MRYVFILLLLLGPTPSKADILDELDRYYDPASLYHTGPEVLADALKGKVASIALLGRYFLGGERGFPENLEVAEKLFRLAYRKGYWASAFSIGEIARDNGRIDEAFHMFAVVWFASVEDRNLKNRKGMWSTTRLPGLPHLSYAELVYLKRTEGIDGEDYKERMKQAAKEAHEMGLVPDLLAEDRCMAAATKYCSAQGFTKECTDMLASCTQ